MNRYILALDQGTTSSRAAVFDRQGRLIALSREEIPQIYPHPGWVEHDPEIIWRSQLNAARRVLKKAALAPAQIAAIGITNQRETAVLWDGRTGKPVANAIVWQCRRTAADCEKLCRQGKNELIREKTGLLLDPYFSATKIGWLLDHVPGLRKRADNGEIRFGTIDSWLLFKLTGRHVTEPSNASRTMLFNIHTGGWDGELTELFGIPRVMLPEVLPSCGGFGTASAKWLGAPIPVGGVLGDQQAALFGQGCFTSGSAKTTYGTGCFALLHTGRKAVTSRHRLLTTVAWDLGTGPEYALEGSVFIGGAVIKWLQEKIHLIKTAAASEMLAETVKDNGGVYFVPAFVGLGAPYWDPDARGAILGITRGTEPAHLVRAAIESIAFQCVDLIAALQRDSGRKIKTLKVDGGASANALLMRFQADILGIPLERPAVAETTVLGAAFIAGLQAGYWRDMEEITKIRRVAERYECTMPPSERRRRLRNWNAAVRAARSFKTK